MPPRRTTKKAANAVTELPPLPPDPIAALHLATSTPGLPSLVPTFTPFVVPSAPPAGLINLTTGKRDRIIFETIRSNIKGGVAERLQPCTAFVGDNRTKKTAVLDSIRVALTGKHAVGHTGADLLALADGNQLIAELTGPTYSARVEIKPGTKTPEVMLTLPDYAQQANPDSFFPLSSISEVVLGTGPKAKQEFFARFGSLTSMPVPSGITAEQQKLWDVCVAETKADDAAERLAMLQSTFRSKKLASSKESKALQADVNARSLAAQADTNYSVPALQAAQVLLARCEGWSKAAAVRQQLDAAKAAHASACALRDAMLAVPMPAEVPADAAARTAEVDALREGVEELISKRTVAKARETEVLTPIRNQITLIANALTMRRASVSAACCVTCATSLPASTLQGLVQSAEAALDHFQADLAKKAVAFEQQEAELVKQHTAAHDRFQVARASLSEHLARAANVYRESYHARTQLAAQLQQTEAQVKTLTAAVNSLNAGIDPGLPLEVAKAEFERLAAVRNNLTLIEEGAVRVRQLDNEFTTYKQLEKIAKEELQKLLETAKGSAEAAINKWMPEGFKAVLILLEEDGEAIKPTYRWEVTGADGFTHRKGALAGSEQAALYAAMACAWSENAPLRIALIDDKDLAGFSKTNVGNFLSMISNRVADGALDMAVVAWSRGDEIPADWYVVRR